VLCLRGCTRLSLAAVRRHVLAGLAPSALAALKLDVRSPMMFKDPVETATVIETPNGFDLQVRDCPALAALAAELPAQCAEGVRSSEKMADKCDKVFGALARKAAAANVKMAEAAAEAAEAEARERAASERQAKRDAAAAEKAEARARTAEEKEAKRERKRATELEERECAKEAKVERAAATAAAEEEAADILAALGGLGEAAEREEAAGEPVEEAAGEPVEEEEPPLEVAVRKAGGRGRGRGNSPDFATNMV
jgi:hypothetical protein